MMLEAGADADTISYTTVVNVYTEAHDVVKAEHWLRMMLRAVVEADTISYTTGIKVCA